MTEENLFIFHRLVSSQVKSFVVIGFIVENTSNVFFRKHINFKQYFQEELESIAKFIKQRGRVSIAELAENSNKLISLNSS